MAWKPAAPAMAPKPRTRQVAIKDLVDIGAFHPAKVARDESNPGEASRVPAAELFS